MNIHSITFKTIFFMFSFSLLFMFFISSIAKNVFSNAYMDIEKEKITIISKNITPSLALNMSYNFEDAIEEIANNTLENKNVLLLEIKDKENKQLKTFSKFSFSMEDYILNNEFIESKSLKDPTTQEKIGKLTIVYSNDSYKKYMDDFNRWFVIGLFIFSLAITLLAFLLYRSLKHLIVLDKSLKDFNPQSPKELKLNISGKDEIASISRSANTMIENIIIFLDASKKLNTKILESQMHLKDAQRMAKVGSWDYDVNQNKLILSDEYYRILGIKKNTYITWHDFLNMISKKDYKRVVLALDDAIKKGSKFTLKYTIVLKNLKEIHIQTKGKVRKKQNKSVRVTAISMDVTNEVENKKTIEQLAYFDPLTGLANRTLLKDRITKALQNAKREEEKLALIFLDLDHFKLINDTLGHSVGDDLLVYISHLLKKILRESDTLSRLGGDEFVILLQNIEHQSDAELVAKKILKKLQNKHDIGTHQLYITSSIGLSLFPEHGDNYDELIRNADTAMYEAKNQGRNRYKTYSNDMGSFIDKQLSLEQDLVDAVKSNGQIEVFYQAKIDTYTKQILGAEALVRWRHPTRGLIFPDDFIYMAESTGLMVELGNIITESAIASIKEFNDLGYHGLRVAINLSARQFQDTSLIPFITAMLDKYNIDSSQVEFEITESISMKNMTNTLKILSELKEIGVTIAIDDFGTGHSSLAYLKKFPIDTLKIDKSFVMGITDNEEDKVIAQTIVSMAHSLNMKTVAEGVETKEHVEMLQNMDCNILQGYFYSKPITKDAFIEFLKDYKIDN